MPTTPARQLRVSLRQAGVYLDLTHEAMRRAAEAGLVGTAGSEAGGSAAGAKGCDAREVLALGGRPFVTDEDLAALGANHVLVVQQAPFRPHNEGSADLAWRKGYGWSRMLTPDAAVDSARAWWPVSEERREGLVGIVSTVSSFVVTLAVVDRRQPVAATSQQFVKFNATPATRRTKVGRLLLDGFEGRRIESRLGSSFLLP